MRERIVALIAAASLIALAIVPVVTDRQADPLDAGWTYLVRHGEGTGVIEAAVALGKDPYDVLGRDLVADVTFDLGTRPIDGLRILYALLVAGERHHSGHDLMAVLDQKAEAAMSAENDAVVSWTILAHVAAGREVPEGLVVRLVQMQLPDGAWQCDGVPGPECTAFAMMALHDDGRSLGQSLKGAGEYLEGRRVGDDYLDPRLPANPVTTAWAAAAMERLGHDQSDVRAHVLAQQHRDGSWESNAWATADIVTLLASGHPIMPRTPA